MVNSWFDPETLQQHSADTRQFMDFRQSTLPDGMRIVEGYNSSGLRFTLLPDRGLDIWRADYKGVPLTWISPGSPHPPDMSAGWLRNFNGGLLTTCGLTHVGPPEVDPETGQQRGLHGRYTFQPAHNVAVTQLDDATVICSADVAQSALFGEQIRIRRTCTLEMGQPTLQVIDTFTNVGDTPTPFMLLYHCNLGYPLVREGTELHVASDVYPRDEAARTGAETWSQYKAATPRYAEQVFFHHLRRTDEHDAQALIHSGEIGLKFTWDADELPYLTQWKNTRQGQYVCGIEPGNCIPEGQNTARDSGRLSTLAPGEALTHRLEITVIEGAEVLTAAATQIQHQQNHGTSISGCDLSGYISIEK